MSTNQCWNAGLYNLLNAGVAFTEYARKITAMQMQGEKKVNRNKNRNAVSHAFTFFVWRG
jgi:hypothetical protein